MYGGRGIREESSLCSKELKKEVIKDYNVIHHTPELSHIIHQSCLFTLQNVSNLALF
jgi:hypothetical protein